MLNAIIFGTLMLCATALLKVSCVLEKETIARSLIINTPNSNTVVFNGHLYTISKNESHIHVNSTDSSYQPCDIAINVARDVIQGRTEVTATEEEIFIVGVQSNTGDDRYKYTLLKVDPQACTYQSVSTPENKDVNGEYDFPKLVRNQMSTDVFFPSLQNCAPCRLNSVGLRTRESTPQITLNNTPPTDFFHHAVQFVNSLNAYFYVRRSISSDQSTLKLLDSNNFRTKKEKIFHFPVYTISKQKKSIGQLGVCTKAINRRIADVSSYTEVRCDKLNSNLDVTSTIRIPIGPDSKTISSISYEFDANGNSYISFAEDTKLRLYIHDKNGKLIKAIDMGAIDAKFEQYPEYEPEYFDAFLYRDVKGFLVNDQYCIITQQSAMYYPTPLHQVECVDVKKYTKH